MYKQGSTGDVYLVIRDGKQYAAKRINNLELSSITTETGVGNRLKHENIINILGINRLKNNIEILLPYYEYSLYDARDMLNITELNHVMHEIIKGIDYMHTHGFIHADLKPANVMLTKIDGKFSAKIIDFGLSMYVGNKIIEYDYDLVTLWYRAPELLLNMPYNFGIDIWAWGIMLLEIYRRGNYFNAATEQNQLIRYATVLGKPNNMKWPGVENAPNYDTLKNVERITTLKTLCDSDSLYDLLKYILIMNPDKRCNSKFILQHPYFNQGAKMPEIDRTYYEKNIHNNLILAELRYEPCDVEINNLLQYLLTFMCLGKIKLRTLLSAVILFNKYFNYSKSVKHNNYELYLSYMIRIAEFIHVKKWHLLESIYENFCKINPKLPKHKLNDDAILNILAELNYNTIQITADEFIYFKTIDADMVITRQMILEEIALLIFASLINQVYFKYTPSMITDTCYYMVHKLHNKKPLLIYSLLDIMPVVNNIQKNVNLLLDMINAMNIRDDIKSEALTRMQPYVTYKF